MPQFATQMSAGRRPAGLGTPVSGAPSASSRGGRRPPFSTSTCSTVRKRLCRLVRSPPQGQHRAWSPNLSATPSQRGQGPSAAVAARRRRICTMVRKRSTSACRAALGTAWSHAPAPPASSSLKWALQPSWPGTGVESCSTMARSSCCDARAGKGPVQSSSRQACTAVSKSAAAKACKPGGVTRQAKASCRRRRNGAAAVGQSAGPGNHQELAAVGGPGQPGAWQ